MSISNTSNTLGRKLTPDQQILYKKIDELEKSYEDLQERLGRESIHMSKDLKDLYLSEISNARKKLEEFKMKSDENKDKSARSHLEMLLGQIEGLYSKKTGTTISRIKNHFSRANTKFVDLTSTYDLPQPSQLPNSTSIVWLIALMLLL